MSDYDDIVSFGRVLAETICAGSTDPTEILLSYFEAPHKWEAEYQKWRALGGTLDNECLRAFEDWYDNKEIAG